MIPMLVWDDLSRILVIRRRGLGDSLVSMQTVLGLTAAAPRAAVDLLIDRPFLPVFTNLVADDRLLGWPPPRRNDGHGWLRMLRSRKYDLVLDLLSTPRTAVWTALSGARWRVGYDLRWRSWAYNIPVPRAARGDLNLSQFAGEGFLDTLRVLGLTQEPWRATEIGHFPTEALDPVYRSWRDLTLRQGRTKVALVLSAGWPAKTWSLDEAGRLTRSLRKDGIWPVLCPGPQDAELVSRIAHTDPDLEIAPPTGLKELADLLGRCDAFVGTDGGARHLAAAVGLPTCTLFGPTDPGGWNPADPRHVSLRTGEPCSPCDLKICPLPNHPCMTGMSARMVRSALDNVLAGEARRAKT